MVLCIVPARKKSKRIKNKNIQEIGGKSLVRWTLDTTYACRRIDETIVLTDCPEVWRIADAASATVIDEPPELSRDDTHPYQLVHYVLHLPQYNKPEHAPEIIVWLEPTHPFRVPALVDVILWTLEHHPEADSIRAVATPDQIPEKMWRIGSDGFLKPVLPGNHHTGPEQGVERSFAQYGYCYAMWRDTILEKGSFSGDKILPHLVPRMPDIDTELDLARARAFYKEIWKCKSDDVA